MAKGLKKLDDGEWQFTCPECGSISVFSADGDKVKVETFPKKKEPANADDPKNSPDPKTKKPGFFDGFLG